MTGERRSGRREGRLYGQLLRAYPAGFRARFEHDMLDTFAREHAAAEQTGRGAVFTLWLHTIWQAVFFGLYERRPRGTVTMEPLRFLDWRDAFRSLRATPVITCVAVLSLALGAGANTALFSILNSVLYKTIPVRNPSELVLLKDGSYTNPIWEQIRDRRDRFSAGAFAWSARRFDISDTSETQYVSGAYVSGDTFNVLGVSAALGRTINAADDTRGGGAQGPVAMLGYDFWQRQYGGHDDVLGRTITVQRAKFTIVGVLPKGFYGVDVGSNLAVVIPLSGNERIRNSRSELDGRSTWWIEIMARLKPGQTPADAALALNGVRAQIREATIPPKWRAKDLEEYLKDPFVFTAAATGMSELRDTYRQPLFVVLIIVGVVLVIACANIANVLIARSTARRHELTVRLALGATRQRLARQLLLESLTIAAAGAGLGLLFAQWGGALLVRQISSATYLDLSPDWRVLGFTAGVAALTAVLFGVAPSLAMVSLSPNDVLKERGRSTTDARFGVRNALVVVQVALSLMLVVGATLFLRTFEAILTRPVGFDVDPLLIVTVNAKQAQADPKAMPLLFERVREASAAVPGVVSAGLSFTIPIGNAGWNTLIVVPGKPNLTDRQRLSDVNLVTPGWFRTFGMRLVAGRDFDARDQAGFPDVTIVTQAFAKKYLSPGDPIGQRVLEEDGPRTKSYEVIGVVEDSAYRSLRSDLQPILYRALAQGGADGPQGSVEMSVRAAGGDPSALARAIAEAVREVNPSLIVTVRPFSTFIQSATRQERLVAMMSGFFGGLALLLAGLGLYGVTSYSVSRRRAEIGIRMALGARPNRIVQMVLGRVGWLVGIGIVAGAGLSIWTSRYIATLLFGVSPHDTLTLIAAAFALGLVGLAAAWLPARRAARIDPTIALRTN